MWQTATVAYREHSRDAGIELSAADDQLDELAASLVAHGTLGSDTKVAMDLVLIARFYERLGDHAVNLARRIDTMAAPRRLSTAQFIATHTPSPSALAHPSKRGGVFGRIRRLRLGPTDERFFELFRSVASNARDGADELHKLMASFSDIDERCVRIKSLEHKGDQLTIEILRRLDTSFITPFDREDIHALAEALDDVIDHIFSAASLIELSKLPEPLPELAEQTAILVAMADELEDLMESLQTRSGARHRLERIENLERQGDAIFRQSLVRLFSGQYAALDVIVWKDVVQAIEDSLNAVEKVSDVVESILVKHS
jgi:predicted phosphate transport protein (TIGR00153 family)